jgi:hypothetical protein
MLWSAFASDAGAVSRFGPIVPVEFAGLKVWHEPQPFAEKTACPALALPPPPPFEDVVVPPDVVVGAEVVVGVDVDPIVTVCTTVADDFPPSEV